MSCENLHSELHQNNIGTQPVRTESRTIVTKRNEEVIFSSRKTYSQSSTIDKSDMLQDEMMILKPIRESSIMSNNQEGTASISTKFFTKRRKCIIGPDGQVINEIIEECDPINTHMSSLPQTDLKSENALMPINSSSSKDISQIRTSEAKSFHTMKTFTSTLRTSEEHTSNFFRDQTQYYLNQDQNNNILNNDNLKDDIRNGVQENNPDGSTFSSKYFSSSTATVSESSTINGETKTSSKSACMCYYGENLLQANSAMSDIETYFNDMMSNLKMDCFDVLNQFMQSPTSNISDHLALAGGNSGSPLLAIESDNIASKRKDSGSSKLQIITKPLKHILSHEKVQEHPTSTTESLETIKKVDEQQQEEIKQMIISSIEQKSSNRLYWSNMEEVKSSGIVNGMKAEEIHLQEGIFEIITSEASYNISLDILIDFFYKNDLLNPNQKDAVINFVEKNNLFSNILLVKGVSFKFLKDLENRWSESKPKITDFADIILKHVGNEEFEQHYVNYLANQSFQITYLKKLMQKDSVRSVLHEIQNNPKCCKLSLDSFLALPMQRLTRLKLLLEVVLKLMNRSEELRNSIPSFVITNHENALNKVKELLNKSEAKKFEMDQKARLMSLWNILDFGKIVNVGSNKLIVEEKVMAHIPQIYPNALKKLSKKRQPSFHLIVLSEFVLIAKIKSPTKLLVLDYCNRKSVEATVNPPSNPPLSKVKLIRDRSYDSQIYSSLRKSKDLSDMTQVGTGQMFMLKFEKSENNVLSEPILLDTSSINSRDQLVAAIMSK